MRSQRLGVRRIHLNEDAVDLDGYIYEPLNPEDANPPFAAISRALRTLATQIVQEAEAKRRRSEEASQSLRRRFRGRPDPR